MKVTVISPEVYEMVEPYWQAIGRLTRADFVFVSGSLPGRPRDAATVDRIQKSGAKKGIQIEMPGMSAVLELEGLIDLDAERSRLERTVASFEKERDGLAARLSNPNFTERAKPEAVEKARVDHAEKAAEAERYRAALERLA